MKYIKDSFAEDIKADMALLLEIQKKWFVRQLELAREVKLPVVIHSRDAAKDTMDIMHSEHAEEIGGVVHCFSYSKEIAKIQIFSNIILFF